MKWVSHIILTGTFAYAVTTDPLLTCAAAFGAVLPDKVEGSPRSIGFRAWRARHRGLSHWPLLYLFGIPVLRYGHGTSLYDPMFFALLFWMLAGALCHIAEDALCGKVPLLLPSQKVGIRLFTVGSVREYLIVLLAIGAVYLFRGELAHLYQTDFVLSVLP